jgi:hypothetical protein
MEVAAAMVEDSAEVMVVAMVDAVADSVAPMEVVVEAASAAASQVVEGMAEVPIAAVMAEAEVVLHHPSQSQPQRRTLSPTTRRQGRSPAPSSTYAT